MVHHDHVTCIHVEVFCEYKPKQSNFDNIAGVHRFLSSV